MLIVLMALVELGRTKVHKATRWLWLALSGGLVAAPAGCDLSNGPSDPGGGPTDMVSPTPDAADAFEGVDAPVYGPPPDVVVDAEADVPQVLYGPPPDYENDVPLPEYGPPPDFDGDVPQDAQPVDVQADVVDVPPADCEPIAIAYGPPSCASDKDCESWYGKGWYCDKPADPCGYAMCRPVTDVDAVTPDAVADVVDCGNVGTFYGPAPVYGPPPCATDKDCEGWYGAGAKCVKNADPCAPNWCEAAPDVDVPPEALEAGPDCPGVVILYGPSLVPCESDEQCVKQHGAGWVCDKSDPCMTFCKPK
jgi:hypothetical protein